ARRDHRRLHRAAHAGRERRVLRKIRSHHRAGLRHRADPRGPARDRARARRRLSRSRHGSLPHAPRDAAPFAHARRDPRASTEAGRAQPRPARRNRRRRSRVCEARRGRHRVRRRRDRRAGMKPGLPVWRSLLYVPVNVEKYVDKAHTRGADCILLDLEDSVPAHEKDNARKLVAGAAKRVRRAGADVAVRVNRPDSMTPRDLEAAVGPEVNAIAVTKVDDAAHLRRLDKIVAKLEAKRGLKAGHTKFIAMVETPAAFFKMPEIAAAVERNVAMDIGGEDFALENGMEPTEEALLMPKQQMIYAARSAGIMPLGYIASVASFGDLSAFRRMVERSRQFGFMGA